MSNRTLVSPAGPAHVGPNMTPMVDIVLCILIFFMLSMTFARPEIFLTSDLVPGAGLGTVSEITKMPALTVTVAMKRLDGGGVGVRLSNSDSAAFLPVGHPENAGANHDAEAARNDVIAARLRKIGGEGVLVILSPESNVPYDDVIKVYDACVKAKLSKVAFSPAG